MIRADFGPTSTQAGGEVTGRKIKLRVVAIYNGCFVGLELNFDSNVS